MFKGNRIGRIMVLGTSCFMLLIFSGCAHYAIDDKPLVQWSPASNKEIGRMVAGNRSSEVLVLVAFPGAVRGRHPLPTGYCRNWRRPR
jgi:hypothetical protein